MPYVLISEKRRRFLTEELEAIGDDEKGGLTTFICKELTKLGPLAQEP